MDTIFELRGVSYAYAGKYEALRDISINIKSGEQIAIMGANGSGKSTLLSILNALIYPTKGEYYAFGNPVEADVFDSLGENEACRYFRKKVGFVFQNSDIQLFSSTVYDEIAFGPLQLDLPKEEVKQRVEDIISLMGISHLRDRSPHTLSGGEKKKVCIASVLSVNPDVLLLDEPTAGLDPRSQLWLVEFLQELGMAGKTIITATHDIDIIEEISTRAVVFGEDHRILIDDDSKKIMKDLDLLLKANLIHRHRHKHGSAEHEHLHAHGKDHVHTHVEEPDHKDISEKTR